MFSEKLIPVLQVAQTSVFVAALFVRRKTGSDLQTLLLWI